MRFLSMVRINEGTGQKPSERLLNEMGKLLDEMTRAGVLLDTAGLRPTSEGVRVRLSRGRISVVDGPFTETKEVIGGFAMFEVGSREEALDWTRRFLEVHGDEWEIDCELRQVEEMGPEGCGSGPEGGPRA
ncbi:transcriptional regulator [Frateuria sp. Soil773]|uniref:YciI family protein n=1 Tax=Frateuria sp. Soil773 TaxID=1736407 RepID=UPI0006F9EB7E|nr:YciI family protein [Frateuria sp. Soil773]KRE89431.1 transcriptional regulator [Frateuria sp. Soil773]